MSEMKVEILSKDTIKPSSPTPHHLGTVDLSFQDLKMPPVFVGGLFFYGYDGGAGEGEISGRLKKSLSETLTRFYPLAGRINGNVVECDDEGALFIVARVGVSLSDLLVKPDPPSLVGLMPSRSPRAEPWPLLLVEVTFFSCGGFALGIFVSHIVADVTTFSVFLRCWSATAKGSGDMVRPDFFAASRVFPCSHIPEPYAMPPNEESHETSKAKPEFTTKRFVFPAEKIESLKNRVASKQVKDPTRFEVIAALLWRCVAKATKSNNGVTRPSLLQFSANIRTKNISPLLSENSMGNIILSINVESDGYKTSLEELVKKLRDDKEKALERFRATEAMKVMEEFERMRWEFMCRMITGAIDGLIGTSWARTGLYEADFGFGNPIWVTANNLNWEFEAFVLVDTRDGQGVEAWVSLMVEKMSSLEKDHELLEFAEFNPSVM